MTKVRPSITNVQANVEMNRHRWGDAEEWSRRDALGYQWDGGVVQRPANIAWLADRFLREHTNNRYNLKILELACGAGRFSVELMRYAKEIDFLDMNQACLTICRSRFQQIPIKQRYYCNDGLSCDMLESLDYDLIASFDSLVHVHPDIVHGYVRQLADRIVPGGILWLDHSGKGMREQGHRTDMTLEKMAEFAQGVGLEIVKQTFRNDHDCISVLRRPVTPNA